MKAPELLLAPPLRRPARADALRLVVRSRHRDRDFALKRMLLVADFLGLWLALALAMEAAGERAAVLPESLWLLPLLPAWALLFRAYGLYRRPLRRFEPTHLDDASPLFHALLVGSLATWLFFRALPAEPLALSELLIFALLALPVIAILRATVRAINLATVGPERVFVIAPSKDVETLARKLGNHPECAMELIGAVTDDPVDGAAKGLAPGANGHLDEIEALMAAGRIEHLVVRIGTTWASERGGQDLMHLCHREGVRFSCFPGAGSPLLPGVELNHVEGMGLLTSDPPVLSKTSRLAKRVLDIVASATLLALLAPVVAVAALAVRLDSRGPVVYRQIRVGRHGRRFQLRKLRTMVPGADHLDDELMPKSVDPDWLVMEDDPRVTRVGRVLRRNSIDELPQLWNVLKGEMSMVGPRPLSERDDRNVKGWKRHRLDLAPGLTGYWQILGRNKIPFREMLEVDYAYIAHWSMWHDIKILARTVPIVLLRHGAN